MNPNNQQKLATLPTSTKFLKTQYFFIHLRTTHKY